MKPSALISPFDVDSHEASVHTHTIFLKNQICVNLAFCGRRYLGIEGAQWKDSVILVQGRGSLPHIHTPEGRIYTEFNIIDIIETEERAIIKLEAVAIQLPLKADLDRFGFPQLAQNVEKGRDTLELLFEAQEQSLEGESYYGFSLSYHWSSSIAKIHWLYESVAIAPGGAIDQTLLLAQNLTQNFCPLEMVVDIDSAYSTQEHYKDSCIEAPCRGGGSSPFDLVQSDRLSIVTYFEAPCAEGNMLKANCQTMPGEGFVTVSDFHYGKMTNSFRTAPRIVLVTRRQDTSREDALNRWTRWFDYTADSWCESIGVSRTYARQTLTLEGTGVGGVDPGTAYPDLLTVWISRLDWLVENGFEVINLHTPEWNSAANSETKVFGGNNCCPWEFKLSEHLGGLKGLRTFCDACHERGIKVFIWVAGHLHREAPVWKHHPEWIVRRPDLGLWDGHYGVIHSISLIEPSAQDWVFDDLKLLREETGVDGIWFDSWTNLCMGAVNWQRADRGPNAPGLLQLIGRLGQIGYELMIECMSPLGVSSWGNLKHEELRGREALLLNSNLRYYINDWLGEDGISRDQYFRSLAARAPFGVWMHEYMGRPEPFPVALPDWFASLTRDFNAVVNTMEKRILYSTGALWLDSNGVPAVWFAFSRDIPEQYMDASFFEPSTGNRVSNLKSENIYTVRLQ